MSEEGEMLCYDQAMTRSTNPKLIGYLLDRIITGSIQHDNPVGSSIKIFRFHQSRKQNFVLLSNIWSSRQDIKTL